MDSIVNVLDQLDFFTYLNEESVLEFSKCSTTIHTNTSTHISKYLTFLLPAFVQHTRFFPPSFLSGIKNSNKLQWNCCNLVSLSFFEQFPVTHFTICGEFSKSIDNNLPSSITHLIFGDAFNGMVDYLPQKLVYLSFGFAFNFFVDNLPQKLQNLTFCKNSVTLGCFNQSLDFLPPSLKLLYIFTDFRHHLLHLPSSLEELHFCDFGFEYCLPPSLLRLHYLKDEPLLLPKKIVDLPSLPQSLQYLYTNDNFCQDITELPSALKILRFGILFDHNVDFLPLNLTHLEFGRCFDKPVDNLPSTLTHLVFGNFFDHPVDNLPTSLKYLKFGENFDQAVNNLPHGLFKLAFGERFNDLIDKLPNSITDLRIQGNFSESVNSLPPLRKLFLHYYTKYPDEIEELEIESISLPESLEFLSLHFDYFQDENYICKLQHVIDNLPRFLTNLALSCAFQRVDNLLPLIKHI